MAKNQPTQQELLTGDEQQATATAGTPSEEASEGNNQELIVESKERWQDLISSKSTNDRLRGIDLLFDEKQDTIIELLAGSNMRWRQLRRDIMRCCYDNPKLLECTPMSLVESAREAATLRLQLDGVLGHAYLVPYASRATLLPGYKGLIALARRSGEIKYVGANEVRKGDEYQVELGSDPKVIHKPSQAGNRFEQPVEHFYAVLTTTKGGVYVATMSAAEIEAWKIKYAKGHHRNDSPWKTAPIQMGKKTVLRQVLKLAPLEIDDVERLVQRDEYYEVGAPLPSQEKPKIESGDTAPADDLNSVADAMGAAQ